jgi:subtilisin family serine protease
MLRLLFIFLVCLVLKVKSEDRNIIAVIDSGINWSDTSKKFKCDLPEFNFSSDLDARDYLKHGTIINNLITDQINFKTHCILNIKVFGSKTSETIKPVIDGLKAANAVKAEFINLSYSGFTFDNEEKNEINKAVSRGAKVITASGNNSIYFKPNLCFVFPACYNITNNFYVVSNNETYANKGYRVNRFVNTSLPGTSFSAAIFTGLLARGIVK